jgi:hypothetical protein
VPEGVETLRKAIRVEAYMDRRRALESAGLAE